MIIININLSANPIFHLNKKILVLQILNIHLYICSIQLRYAGKKGILFPVELFLFSLNFFYISLQTFPTNICNFSLSLYIYKVTQNKENEKERGIWKHLK